MANSRKISNLLRPLADRRAQTWMAFAICLGVVLAQTLVPEFRRPVADANGYARAAVDLADAWATAGKSASAAFGVYFSPLYPGFLALMTFVDGAFMDALKCVRSAEAACNLSGLTLAFTVQGVLAALSTFFVFLATRRLTADTRVAWLTLVIVLAAKTFADYASQLLTESLAFFFVMLFTWLLSVVLTDRRPRMAPMIWAGAALGLATLTKPSYQYLIIFMAPVLFLWIRQQSKEGARGALRLSAVYLAAAAIMLLPWVVRNYFDVGAVTVSAGGARVFVERLPYNLMTWPEWGMSFIYWLPDFGDNLAAALFSEGSVRRLSWYHPDSFYMMGRGPFFHEVRALAGQHDSPLGFMLREYVWGDLTKHLAVTVTLAVRGMWVGNYVSLVGFILLPGCIWVLARQGRLGPFLIYCLPPFFMLGLYAFVSVNVVRYNEPLIAVFALSAATVIVRLADHGANLLRRTRKQS
jgi:4-amino-4-deoxy-L-arabinose transferase-like glycosyltransferase